MKKTVLKRLVCASLAVLMTAALAACGGSSSSSSAPAASGATSAASSAAGENDWPKKDITIVSEDVKVLGVYDAEVKCYKDVKGAFKFEIIAE